MITILIIIKNKYHFIQLGTNIDTQYDYQKIQSKKKSLVLHCTLICNKYLPKL